MGMSESFRNCYRDNLSDIVDEIHERRGQAIPALRRPKRLVWRDHVGGMEIARTEIGFSYIVNDTSYGIQSENGPRTVQSANGRENARMHCQRHFDAFVESLLEDV